MSTAGEAACSYAALILYDDGIPITVSFMLFFMNKEMRRKIWWFWLFVIEWFSRSFGEYGFLLAFFNFVNRLRKFQHLLKLQMFRLNLIGQACLQSFSKSATSRIL